MKVSIVVPLWNEADNMDGLVAMLAASETIRGGQGEAVLVENGSSDSTKSLLQGHAERNPWIRPLFLTENQNYGGGLLAGAAAAAGDIVCFIPGDLQYDAQDMDKVVARALERQAGDTRVLVKGNRLSRLDSRSMRLVSSVYTSIANLILGLRVADVNGLPKAFDRRLLNALPPLRMKTFVLDAQLIHVARLSGWAVEELDVTFHARRAGVSSWSGKRFQTYLRSLRQLWQVRMAGAAKVGG